MTNLSLLGDYPAHYTPVRLLTPLEFEARDRRLFWEHRAKYVCWLRYDIHPMPQGRPRCVAIRLKTGKYIGKMYPDAETEEYQKRIGEMSRILMEDMTVIQGIRLGAKVDFFTDGKNEDLDNLVKALLDGMQGAVFANDNAFDYLAPMRVVTKDVSPYLNVLLLSK